MPSTEAQGTYSAEERRILLGVAARSIEHGLDQGAPLAPDPGEYPPALRALRATFVTLEIDHALRGCIGVLEAIRPLVVRKEPNSGKRNLEIKKEGNETNKTQ